MDSVKVYITNRQKEVKIPTGTRLLIRRCCHAVLDLEGMTGSAEVSVSFLNNKQIRELNAEYRNIDRETDVLSFPMGENGVFDTNQETGAAILGDIAISVEKAVEQAKNYGHSFSREIGFLTVHSMLHLLGYDHEQGGLEAVRMREKEEEVLSRLGLQRDASYVMGNE
ncbi:rRNA maturation RNase YbeY [Clostridiaceae bacterium NSJ-31]|uniref:Endoribonuclease YbeY n=1 Tax=Ligaoa zhengdingensis TaxID=2763658 RepID=A0A926DUL6_9FIRM|nr:rRNA maturation RNase YbeY [Ligaoa zhengdingensis]MBC8545575.1 rRNA maturation RNase YbeY [Ligaoa zhengdingensis]